MLTKKIKKYSSIVNEEIMKSFETVRGITLMNHAFNSCMIEDVLAIASVFCPKIVEIKGYLFIDEFYNGNLEVLERQYNGDRKQVEKHVNSWSLSDFFLLASNLTVQNDKVIEEFGKVLKYFWTKRFQELFPDRNVIVEIKENTMGERGLAITVYQAE